MSTVPGPSEVLQPLQTNLTTKTAEYCSRPSMDSSKSQMGPRLLLITLIFDRLPVESLKLRQQKLG
jgi:hypothetical protein